MESVCLGSTELKITRAGMGGCPLGGHGWGRVDDSESVAAVRRALDLGITFFDTADVYGFGHSEQILSDALGADRNRVVIASKFGVKWSEDGRISKDASPAYLRKALDASLRRLRLDCIPLYYIHWPDGVTPISETVAELARCKEQGKIRCIGLSNFSIDQVREAMTVTAIDAIQVPFSLVDRDVAIGLLPLVKESKITVVTWGSLAQGLLTGKYTANCEFADNDRRSRYENFRGAKFQNNMRTVESVKQIAGPLSKTPAQVAIRWLLDTPGVGSVLFGAKRPAQVEDNVAALGWRLSEKDYHALESATTNSSSGN